MSEKIKVLIVDDAIVVRILVGNTLSKDPEIEFVGKAENGKVALEQIRELQPDVVLLDIEMPEMNGLEVLKHLKEQGMPTKVIMFSTYTTVGAKHTFEALELGAADFVPKPSSSGFSKGFENIQDELLSKIKFIGRPASQSGSSLKSPATTAPRSTGAIRSGNYELVMIEGGTGAPKTFMNIMPQFPEHFPAGILIFQTMFSGFAEQFVRRLERNSHVPVTAAEDRGVVRPGEGMVLFGDHYAAVKRSGMDVQLAFRDKESTEKYGSVPRILCESLARVYGKKAIAVLLAGAGEGNLEGIQAMKEQGALILAEEPASLIARQVQDQFVERELIDRVVATQDIVPTLTTSLGLPG